VRATKPFRVLSLAAIALTGAVGCTTAPGTGTVDTGAKGAVRAYYEALIRQDWPGAYRAVHPDGRKRWSPEQFARLAQSYRRNVGFDPAELHVRSCEEHGQEAVAHVTLFGPAGPHRGRYGDGVTLRQSDEGWRVVLPPDFGRPTPR
jgi:hypothetical protein